MKRIYYTAEFGDVVLGPFANTDYDANYALAKAEAVGEIVVEELPDPDPEPTTLERLEAQVLYTALVTDTLLDDEEG